MPSFFRSKKTKDDKAAEAKHDSQSQSQSQSSNANLDGSEDLPAYTPQTNSKSIQGQAPPTPPPEHDAVDVDVSAAFSNLSLSSAPKDPDADTCLAHLKLLFAIQSMKEDVGYTDGLWNIWDNRAEAGFSSSDGANSVSEEVDLGLKKPPTPEEEKKIVLSKIREKRWALFVARAVDRYEAWWNSFNKSMLHEADMYEKAGANYANFTETMHLLAWDETMLPPLDVLMGKNLPNLPNGLNYLFTYHIQSGIRTC